MKKSSMMINCFAAVALATTVGCGGSSDKTGTAGNDGGGNPNAIIPTADGFVDSTANSVGILGAWYSYADSYKGETATHEGDCQAATFTADKCSTVITPVLGAPFTNSDGKMCTQGIAAQTIPVPGMSAPAYSAIWGAGIGLDFNNAGTDGGTGTKQAWNATGAGVTGFSFDISDLEAGVTGKTIPIGGKMRVEFPATSQSGNDAAYWNGKANNLSPVMKGTNTIRWAMVNGPMYNPTAPDFDPTKVLSIQFHVVSEVSAAIPYGFCISNLVPLTN